jgi:hypothetical protein
VISWMERVGLVRVSYFLQLRHSRAEQIRGAVRVQEDCFLSLTS